MRNLLYALILCFNIASLCKADDAIVLVFEKNKGGEVVARISGHKIPIIFKINDQNVTVYPEEGTINLSAMGIETLLLSLRTDSGGGQNPDNSVVLPVQSNPVPAFSTPY